MKLFSNRGQRGSFFYLTVLILGMYCFYRLKYIQELESRIKSASNLEVDLQTSRDSNTTDDDFLKVEALKESYRNMTRYPLFQPIDEVEFPTIKGGMPRIPHILHQIWENESIPDCFTPYMQSFVEQNPGWEHRFWTYDSGRKLLKDRFPYLVDVYDGFENTVRRSDLLRYAVIYEFGGVYSDVDVKNVRPLDIATIRYACILPTETFEHSTLLNDMQMIINTAVLLCRPKHPFFKLLLHNLQVVNGNLHPVHLTGPGFITRVYMKYNNLQIDDLSRPKTDNDTNSPYFYKGTRDVEDDDGLYIPNTQYFMDTIDPWIIDKNDNIEDCVDFKLVHDLLKRGCAEYEHRRELRKRKKYAFTIHYWTHIWAMPESMKRSRLNYINVKYIVPSCILY